MFSLKTIQTIKKGLGIGFTIENNIFSWGFLPPMVTMSQTSSKPEIQKMSEMLIFFL